MMMLNILIAIAAGCASGLMFASIISGALISLVLFYLAPLPLMVRSEALPVEIFSEPAQASALASASPISSPSSSPSACPRSGSATSHFWQSPLPCLPQAA